MATGIRGKEAEWRLLPLSTHCLSFQFYVPFCIINTRTKKKKKILEQTELEDSKWELRVETQNFYSVHTHQLFLLLDEHWER